MKRLLIICMLVVLGNGVFGQGIEFMDNEPWSKVLQRAKEQNQLIFMDCYTVWCGPCKGLAQDVFPQKQVGDFFNAHFVNVKYDMEKGDGKMLREKYKEYIIGFPTLLLLDGDGNVVHQMAGYQKAENLIAGMKAGMEGKSLPALQKKYEAGVRDFETIRDYVAALNGAFKRENIPTIISEFIATIPMEKLKDKEIWNLVGKYITDPYSEAYQYVFKEIEKYQYRMDVNRYDLERQLADGMGRAVKEIIRVTTSTTDPDTLKMMAEKADILRGMLIQNTVKRFPMLLCKLRINDCRLAGDVEGMYSWIMFADDLNLLNYENDFRGDTYMYITERTKDKKVLNSILDVIGKQQEKEDQVKSDLVKQNYYDLIATLYTRLGRKDKAVDARKKYEQLEEEKKAAMVSNLLVVLCADEAAQPVVNTGTLNH